MPLSRIQIMPTLPRFVSVTVFALVVARTLLSTELRGDDAAGGRERDSYPITSINLPEAEVLEIGAIEPMPDGRIAIATRRGEIWFVDDALSGDSQLPSFHRFAHGLHEVLGLAWRDGWLYATQRCEVTRLRDSNDDGMADNFETISDAWSITGDYHEYAFGSKFDAAGNIWVALCLTGSFGSDCPWRGWCVRITPDGHMIPTCSGLRSPGGIGFNAAGETFYTDNQGPWNGTCSLKWLRPQSFQGHPGGNRWYANAREVMGQMPLEPVSGSRIIIEADRIPEFEPPCIQFPYKKMGQSASGIACDVSEGRFGPFAGQLFVGDQTYSTIMRCFVELVDGHYQGACFPFREGFSSGAVAVQQVGGSLFVGGTNRGWGSRGTKPFSLERLDWSGTTPFEIHEMSATTDGFRVSFTEPVAAESARNLQNWQFSAFTYIYQSSYGSPEVDHSRPAVTAVVVSEDGLSCQLSVKGRQRGHVHELHIPQIKSADGKALLHDSAWYTLNFIPRS